MSPHEQDAAIIVIGDEVLSGSVEDINSTYLMRSFRELGVRVKQVAIVPDDHDVIVATLRAFAAQFAIVVTTGGVGPTHDDITFEAVAVALDRPLEHSPEMESCIRNFFGEKTTEAWLTMAQIPRGTELVWTEGLPFPVTLVDNVWVLPGEPNVMKAKFEGIKERFRQVPIHRRQVWLIQEEGDIADLLAEIVAAHPVQVGSYPTYERGLDYKVRVSFEARDEAAVVAAQKALLGSISAETVVRTD